MVNKVLSNNILKQYDGLKVTNKVLEVYDLINYLDNVIEDFLYPSITSNCLVRYEQFIKGVNSSKLENFVLDKLLYELSGNDYKRKLFMTKLTIALRKLNDGNNYNLNLRDISKNKVYKKQLNWKYNSDKN